MYKNSIETVIAKQDISDVIMRYARAIDRADGELLHSCYWDDAIEEHGSSYNGPARDYIDGAMERILAGDSVMTHHVGNMHIELEGDLAWVETYVLTFARFPKDGEPWDTLTGARLFDKFECRDGEWRIKHRKMAFDWNRDAPSSETWCVGLFDPADPRMIMGQKGKADLTYSRF